ncbi:MAG: helicase HerA-like domain-containing protein, partial [Pseudomonadota bacterium]
LRRGGFGAGLEHLERALPIQGLVVDAAQDRESAFEMLKSRAEAAAAEAQAAPPPPERAQKEPSRMPRVTQRSAERARAPAPPRAQPSMANELLGAAASATVSMLKSRSGQAMVRGLLGSLFKGR